MKIKVLGSNSDGNCYLMTSSTGETLIIELGLNFKEVTKALNFTLSNVVGALVTHCHQDHAVAVPAALSMGVKVVMSKGSAEKLNVAADPNLVPIAKHDVIKLGDFEIMSFDVNHNCRQPIGFLIRHPESGVTCFITDSYYIQWKFEGLNTLIVEANHCEKIMMANDMNPKLRDQIITAHMSIKTCINFLQNQDLSAVNNVMLVHLSDSNSNAADFKRQAEEATGKPVTIAKPGIEIDLSLNPF